MGGIGLLGHYLKVNDNEIISIILSTISNLITDNSLGNNTDHNTDHSYSGGKIKDLVEEYCLDRIEVLQESCDETIYNRASEILNFFN